MAKTHLATSEEQNVKEEWDEGLWGDELVDGEDPEQLSEHVSDEYVVVDAVTGGGRGWLGGCARISSTAPSEALTDEGSLTDDDIIVSCSSSEKKIYTL